MLNDQNMVVDNFSSPECVIAFMEIDDHVYDENDY